MQQQNVMTTRQIPKKIFDLLEREVRLSKDILDLLEAEKNALSTMDMPSLISLSRKKATQVATIQSVDESLQETARQLANLPAGRPVKLEDLASVASGQDVEQIKAYRKQLTLLREEILGRNMLNKRFAEDTKGFLNDAISLITGSFTKKQVYGTKGLDKPSSKQPTLISREV